MKKMLLFFMTTFLVLFNFSIFANCKTKRQVYIENNETKVWKTIICPKQQLPFHTHQYARIAIPQQSGLLQVNYKDGRKKFIALKKGIPHFLTIKQGNYLHQDVNLSKSPIEVIIIELKNTVTRNG